MSRDVEVLDLAVSALAAGRSVVLVGPQPMDRYVRVIQAARGHAASSAHLLCVDKYGGFEDILPDADVYVVR